MHVYAYELKPNDMLDMPGGKGKVLSIVPIGIKRIRVSIEQYIRFKRKEWVLETTTFSLWRID
jgi:hypothetical protein